MSARVRPRYDLRMLRFAVVLVAATVVAGCAAPRQVAPVGSQHAAYAGLPLYLEPASRQHDGDALKKLAAKRHGGTAPIHLSAPASQAAPVDETAASQAGEPPAAADAQPSAGPSESQPQIVTPGP